MNKRGIVLFGIIAFFMFSLVNANVIDRGSNWNKIDNGDGSFGLEIYNGIVNYDNGSGYDFINLSLNVSSDPLYDYEVNNAGFYSSFFNVDPTTGQPVKYLKDNVEIAFRPMPLYFTNAIGQLDQISNVLGVIGTAQENSFNYADIYGSGISFRYLYLPTMLKEELVINSFSDLPLPGLASTVNVTLQMNFNFNTNAPRLIIEGTDLLDGNNEVTSTDSVEVQDIAGNLLYFFPKPYAYDSNGSRVELTYIFKKQGPSLSIKLLTPYDWLNATERVYPVYIDPSIKINASEPAGMDAYVGDAGDANKNFGSSNILKTGDGARTYLMFNITSIPADKQIDLAQMCVYLQRKKDQKINLSHMYVGFDESTLTWNNQPCGTNFDNASACNLTSESIVQMNETYENTWRCFDVKNMISKTYGDSENLFRAVMHTNDADINEYASKDVGDATLHPYLNITYSNVVASPSWLNLSIVSPANTTYTLAGVYVNFSVNSSDLDSVWFFNGTDNVSYVEGYYNFSEGQHELIAYANDIFGNLTSATVSFYVDIDDEAPLLSIISPINTSYNTSSIYVNISAIDVDSNLDSVWFFNGSENVSYVEGDYNFSEGQHELIAYANDIFGNLNSSAVSFSVNLTVTGNQSNNQSNDTGFDFSGYVLNVYPQDYTLAAVNDKDETQNIEVGLHDLVTDNVTLNISYYIDAASNFTFLLNPSSVMLNSSDNVTNPAKVIFSFKANSSILEGTYYGNISFGNGTDIFETVEFSYGINPPAGQPVMYSDSNVMCDGEFRPYDGDSCSNDESIEQDSSFVFNYLIVNNGNNTLEQCFIRSEYNWLTASLYNFSLNKSENKSFTVTYNPTTVNSVAVYYDFLYVECLKADAFGNQVESLTTNRPINRIDVRVKPVIIINNDGGSSSSGGGGGVIFLPVGNNTGKIDFGSLSDIVARDGDSKTMSIKVRNTGGGYLNKCKLKFFGDYASWIYVNQIAGIAPGEYVDFVYSLNIPEGTEPGSYKGEIGMFCEETNKTQTVFVRVPTGLQVIQIGEVVHEDGILDVNYLFNNSDNVDEEVLIDVWLVDPDGVEVKRINDLFVSSGMLTSRDIELELGEEVYGIYSLYLAKSDDPTNFVRQSVVLGESGATGQVIGGGNTGRIAGAIVLGLIVLAGAIFMARGYVKHKKKKRVNEKNEKKKISRKPQKHTKKKKAKKKKKKAQDDIFKEVDKLIQKRKVKKLSKGSKKLTKKKKK
ncbi:DNRLRE domain-containing protein [Candidatus Pacearchaeota archaeon]|nr:DNRLRE domain-containing protein [Candidatus Pacearchaeota archaeon]